MLRRTLALGISLLFGAAAMSTAAAAADLTIRLAQQRGLTYLPLIVMEHEHLIEKHAKALGLGDVDCEWTRFGGGSPMNDALLSGNLDFAATGLPGFAVLWDKAQKVLPISGVTSYGSAPLYLVTKRPEVKSIADFTETDRIAVPTVKASAQAIMLQMAAKQQLGQYDKLDHLTVSLSHPDAMAALLSPNSEITAHFGAPPYIFQELERPGLHRVLSNFDVFGGPVSNGILYTTQRFYDANPKVIRALMDAMSEAMTLINTDSQRAAQIYLDVSGEKASVEDIHEIISNPGMIYEMTPRNTYTYVRFMYDIGTVKREPTSWTDLFFPVAHKMPGS